MTVNSLIFQFPKLNEKTIKIPYYTVETTPNIKIVKRGQIDTVNTQILTVHFPVFGIDTSIKSDEAKLALLAQASPLSEMT